MISLPGKDGSDDLLLREDADRSQNMLRLEYREARNKFLGDHKDEGLKGLRERLAKFREEWIAQNGSIYKPEFAHLDQDSSN